MLLMPGDPDYTPYPGEKVRHKHRPRPPSSHNTETPHLIITNIMQPFRYIIYLIKSLFTARADLREAMSGDQFLDTLATRTGRTRAECEDFLQKQFALQVELARQGIPVDFVLNLFRILPVAAGRYPNANPDGPSVRGNLRYGIIVHPNEIAKMQDGTPVEKTDEKAGTVPVVEGIHATPSGALHCYGVGTMAGSEADGEFFREGFYNAPKPTAALVDENGGSPIPIAVLYCTPSHLVLGGAPAGTTGVKFLKITAGYGDEPFTICPDPITPG